MKQLLTKTLILVFGLSVATALVSCHTGVNSSEVVTDIAPKHSINGTILKADGTVLNGATVKINGSAVSVSGNTFSRDGLRDGSYTIEITCDNYKSVSDKIDLAVETVNGKSTARNVEKTYYLSEDIASTPVAIGGSAQASDEITIETTDHTDDNGDKINDTDKDINVQAETPVVTGDPNDADSYLGNINQQIKDQSNGEEDINDFKITLSNITSLEDAQAVARANKIATSRMTRATTEMPYNNELLAGVAVNAGAYTITLPGNKTFTITIKMPEDVKGAITLFRTFIGDKWTKVDMSNPNADGIKSIDITTEGVIKIELTKIQTQSFGFGVVVGSSVEDTRWEDVVAEPIVNGSTGRTVTSMPYTVNSGVVLSQSTSSSLTDFLRKIVIRKYGTRVVKNVKKVSKNYVFSPAYQMHANGVLYLSGWQEVVETSFWVENSQAKFTATEYGEAFLAPYEVWNEIDEVVVHGGGSN